MRRSWRTHLYIAAIALLVQGPSPGQPPRELLNSERIAAAFGTYGVEVLEQNEKIRVSNLYSFPRASDRTCRTFAVVQYPASIDPAVGSEHAAIVAGGSIGAVFAASGWEVRKRHLSYAEREASAKLASLMRIAHGVPLAEHVYVLDVVKDGRAIEYAAIVEIHHPAHIGVADLAKIYGPLDVDEKEALLAASLREIAGQRAR